MQEELRRAAWQMLTETGCHEAVALRCLAEAGWYCSERTAVSILSKWLAPTSRRPLPLWAAGIIIDECVARGAIDRVTPILSRLAMRAEDRWNESEAKPQRAALMKVRMGKARRERA